MGVLQPRRKRVCCDRSAAAFQFGRRSRVFGDRIRTGL